MKTAAEDATENVGVLEQTIVMCDTYAEFSAASVSYPAAMDGNGERSFIRFWCGEADELAGEELCEDVGQPFPCIPGFVCEAALVPGVYTSTSTGANITFTLGEGWSGTHEDTPGDVPGDGFGLVNDAVVGTHAITVIRYSGEVYTQVCSADNVGQAAPDFIPFLMSVEGVDAEEPVQVQVGGRPATRLDLTTDSPCNDPTLSDPSRMWLWPLPYHGDFHFDDGEHVRVYAVDAACVTVAIVMEAFVPSSYLVLLEKAEEVIATMTIAPAC
jgi:hypothetical protein